MCVANHRGTACAGILQLDFPLLVSPIVQWANGNWVKTRSRIYRLVNRVMAHFLGGPDHTGCIVSVWVRLGCRVYQEAGRQSHAQLAKMPFCIGLEQAVDTFFSQQSNNWRYSYSALIRPPFPSHNGHQVLNSRVSASQALLEGDPRASPNAVQTPQGIDIKSFSVPKMNIDLKLREGLWDNAPYHGVDFLGIGYNLPEGMAM